MRPLPVFLLPILLLASCTTVPKVYEQPVSHAKPAPSSGPLIQTATRVARHRTPSEASFLLISDARDALDWRLALVDSARSSIDCQYYLWHGDHSGTLLLERLFRAADRGVRVRLLVDDFLLRARERELAAACLHPNFEIRIYNPHRRRVSAVGWAVDWAVNFNELNRRMHNKTFTADGVMSIVGGRNIADHYYGLDNKYNFRDLDVLVAGKVVKDISASFDLFWNSKPVVPGAVFSKQESEKDLQALRTELSTFVEEHRDGMLKSYSTAPRSWSPELAGLPGRMVTGRVQFFSDHPEPEHDERIVVNGLSPIVPKQGGELLISTPYFIPNENIFGSLDAMNSRGTKVRIVAATLQANNQAPVHAYYQKYRKTILKGGAELYEYRHDPSEASRDLADTPPVRSPEINTHLKAMVGSGRNTFIGSLNLDPRAMELNTESALLIDSPALAKQVSAVIEEMMELENAWKVTLDEKGRLRWTSREGTRTSEPPASIGNRALEVFSRFVPVGEKLL